MCLLCSAFSSQYALNAQYVSLSQCCNMYLCLNGFSSYVTELPLSLKGLAVNVTLTR